MNRSEAFPRPKLKYDDEKAMVDFLCDLIALPSTSTSEERVIRRIEREMLEVGFKRVWIDRLGNVIGQYGVPGGKKLLYQAHSDTIGVGSRLEWERDPYEPRVIDGVVWGRGASDSKQAIAAMVYGVKALADRAIQLDGELYVAATVQEEECEGLALSTLIEIDGLRPDYIVLGEATGNHIHRGHRGRLELTIDIHSPNAAYEGARMIVALEALNKDFKEDPLLGRGSVGVTGIRAGTGTGELVPDRCILLVDRRLTLGEEEEPALQELKDLAKKLGIKAEVSVLIYQEPSWRGYTRPRRKCFPTYVLESEHELIQKAARSIESVLGHPPEITGRVSGTDGNCSAGGGDIPSITFGPGDQAHVHSFEDQVAVRDLVEAANIYSLMAIDLIGLAK
ncbi:MAG TPA: YgeY family selenium metabolism-linked hydrolase [Chroococcales cyanobacterium]|jgi:putative selenium metabolism hydrolase